ncbi:MAG: hypothetical protein ACAH83_05285 [Alphaproteobacteria bacterium]
MTQNQKASLRNLTDAELEDKQTATANRSGWREQLAIAAVSISGGVFIGWCVAAALAPAYGIFWMAFVGVTGGMCGCGVMEAAERRFDISKSSDMEDLKQEKKRRERASAPPPAAGPATTVAPPGAMTEDFNSDRIRVLKPITFKKPAATATLTMAGCE